MVDHFFESRGRGSFPTELAFAGRDFVDSLKRWQLWSSLAVHDILARYRGSILGPFWITLSTGFLILGMGLLYSQLFGLTLREYLPYVAIGIVVWNALSQLITEGCDTFIAAGGIMRQTSVPVLAFLWRIVTRNLINLAHQLVIAAAVLTWFELWSVQHLPLFFAGLLLVYLNASWVALIVGLSSARFRDVPQIVASVMYLALFLTPVFWKAEGLRAGRFVLDVNPFHHLLEVTRDPLLGAAPEALSWTYLSIMAVVGWLVAFTVFTLVRRRVVHFV